MFNVNSGFIGDFKTGDNINYNLAILKALYDCQKNKCSPNPELLCKPITITITSVIEALLHDLIFRIQENTQEGVKAVAAQVLKDVRSKKLDKLETYIAAMKKHDLLVASGTDLYEKLNELRIARNRIHIQNVRKKNVKQILDRDEKNVFTQDRQIEAEQVLEKIVKHVSDKHTRPTHAKGFVNTFKIPWDEHFK